MPSSSDIIFDRSKPEEILYEYQVDGGGIFVRLILSSWRLCIVDGSNTQFKEAAYNDLKEISVVEDKLQLKFNNFKVAVDGLDFRIAHFSGVDLWTSYALTILTENFYKGGIYWIDEAISWISEVDVSSLKVPYNFQELWVDKWGISSEIITRFGLQFPFNSYPRLKTSELRARFIDTSTQAIQKNNNIYMPALAEDMRDCQLKAWYFFRGGKFKRGDKLFKVQWYGDMIDIYAEADGELTYIFHFTEQIIRKGEIVGKYKNHSNNVANFGQSNNDSMFSQSEQQPSFSLSSVMASIDGRTPSDQRGERSLVPQSTTVAMQTSATVVQSGGVQSFSPSLARIPAGFQSTGDAKSNIEFAIANPKLSFQSFFNDVDVLTEKGFNDNFLSLPPFDEDLYSKLTREMHRYTLSELADKKEEIAREKANLGTFVGSLLGILTLNPLMPFMGRNMGRMESNNKGKRVEEFLPDPYLIFCQDNHSYISLSRAQVMAPRFRRVMIVPMELDNGNIYYRLLPAIVTQESVYPIQLFKLDHSSYFYRPLAAGIERNQSSYDTVKMIRRYTHFRAEGITNKLDLRVPVYGDDIEDEKTTIYSFSGQNLDYYYADFKKLPGLIF